MFSLNFKKSFPQSILKIALLSFISCFGIGILYAQAQSQSESASSTPTALEEITQPPLPAPFVVDRDFGYADALILGLVEGITEYIPVSSTGHLILVDRFLDLDREVFIPDHQGKPILLRDDSGETRYYTYKEATDAYVIIIQIGAILAVVFLYRTRLISMIQEIKNSASSGRKLAINLLISFLPAAILGLSLHRWILKYFFNPRTVIISLLLGSLLMYWAQRRQNRLQHAAARVGLNQRKNKTMQATEEVHEEEIEDREEDLETELDEDIGGNRDLEIENLSNFQALLIGLAQCIALIPGMSRSMTTLVAGYLVGLRPEQSAEYSFLLGFITLSAASFYQIAKSGSVMLKVFDFGPLLFGIVIAFIFAVLAIRWLINYLVERGLMLFVYYRIGLAIFLIILGVL